MLDAQDELIEELDDNQVRVDRHECLLPVPITQQEVYFVEIRDDKVDYLSPVMVLLNDPCILILGILRLIEQVDGSFHLTRLHDTLVEFAELYELRGIAFTSHCRIG